MRCRYEQGWARRQARSSREGQGEPTGRFPPELIREEGFGPHPEFRTLLVEEGGETLGHALLHPTYSTESRSTNGEDPGAALSHHDRHGVGR